jgi:serine/threonine-protein kinase HipA
MTAVWLYGTRLGELSRPRSGKLRFDFSNDSIDRWGTGSTILSTSMPTNTAVRPPGDVVSAFFQNLLPEGDGLTAMRTLYQAFDDFSLLEAIGRDTAGALIIADQLTVGRDSADSDSPAGQSEPRYLTIEDIGQLIAGLPQRPLGASLTVRHSLAGAQRKLLLGRSLDGRWFEPSAQHPSTHLLKPAPLDHPEVATNEAFCMQVARTAGLEACVTEQLQIGSMRVLVAKRYDRIESMGTVERVHQEDGCQMLGTPPSKKYQERKSGSKTVGPSLAGIAQLLSDSDKVRLLQSQVLNVLVGNADGHGKNVSILHLPDGSTRLAPLYDVMSTVVHHPIPTIEGPKPLTQDLGMLIGSARRLNEVTMAELVNEAVRWPMAKDQATSVVGACLESVLEAVSVCETMYPEIAKHAYQAAKRIG